MIARGIALAAAAVTAAALGLAGCETAPLYREEVPEGGALPPAYYGTPPPVYYYGPPAVYYEYRYGPSYWYPYYFYDWFPGPIIVNPPATVSPPRRQPLPGGGGTSVPAPAPQLPPRRQPLPQ